MKRNPPLEPICSGGLPTLTTLGIPTPGEAQWLHSAHQKQNSMLPQCAGVRQPTYAPFLNNWDASKPGPQSYSKTTGH
eukprot:3569854-Rhodomonas_salina.1